MVLAVAMAGTILALNWPYIKLALIQYGRPGLLLAIARTAGLSEELSRALAYAGSRAHVQLLAGARLLKQLLIATGRSTVDGWHRAHYAAVTKLAIPASQHWARLIALAAEHSSALALRSRLSVEKAAGFVRQAHLKMQQSATSMVGYGRRVVSSSSTMSHRVVTSASSMSRTTSTVRRATAAKSTGTRVDTTKLVRPSQKMQAIKKSTRA